MRTMTLSGLATVAFALLSCGGSDASSTGDQAMDAGQSEAGNRGGGGAGGAGGAGGVSGGSGGNGATSGVGGSSAGTGGSAGSGGAAGSGGEIQDASFDRGIGGHDDGGGVSCGARTCAPGQICCSASCGICTQKGGLCPQIACADL